MHAPKLQVAVTLVGMVELISVREFGEQRARVFGEGVEKESVDDESEGLACSY